MRWLVLVVLVAGCDDPPACRAPAHTTYSCEPIPAGGSGCVGGPTWTSVYGSDATKHQDDPASTFPDGCSAHIPECSPYYMDEPRDFTCTYGQWGELL